MNRYVTDDFVTDAEAARMAAWEPSKDVGHTVTMNVSHLRALLATRAALLDGIDSRPANDKEYGAWAYALHELAAEIRGKG